MSEGSTDLEKKLMSILSNPEALSGIMSIAKGFGESNQQKSNAEQPIQKTSDSVADAVPALLSLASDSALVKPKTLHGNSQFISDKSVGLLLALKPFLSSNKAEKLDVITQVLKIASLTDLFK